MTFTWLDVQAAKDLQANKVAEAKTTAAQAKNWLAGLTTLTGLAATVTVLKGAEKTTDLGPVQLGLAILATVLSLACLIFGVWKAYVASYGSPGLSQVATSPLDGLHARVIQKNSESAQKTAKALSAAIGFTITGVALLVVASLITWIPMGKADAAKSVCIFTGEAKVAEVNAGSVDLKSLAAGSRVGPCS